MDVVAGAARLLRVELAQELEATSLRVDNTLSRLAARQHADTAAEAAGLLDGFGAVRV